MLTEEEELFLIAIEECNVAIVKDCLQAEVDVNRNVDFTKYEAVHNGEKTLLDAYIKYQPVIEGYGSKAGIKAPLWFAVFKCMGGALETPDFIEMTGIILQEAKGLVDKDDNLNPVIEDCIFEAVYMGTRPKLDWAKLVMMYALTEGGGRTQFDSKHYVKWWGVNYDGTGSLALARRRAIHAIRNFHGEIKSGLDFPETDLERAAAQAMCNGKQDYHLNHWDRALVIDPRDVDFPPDSFFDINDRLRLLQNIRQASDGGEEDEAVAEYDALIAQMELGLARKMIEMRLADKAHPPSMAAQFRDAGFDQRILKERGGQKISLPPTHLRLQ